MTKYLVTYHGAGMPSSGGVEQAKAAFGKWFKEAGSSVVDPGAPVKMVAKVGSGPSVDIGGYVIIEASDKDAALKVLETHPFASQGDSHTLQVNEIMVA
jgi:hypothetical protein